MASALDQLRVVLAEVSDLNEAYNLLEWDSETYMPPGGVGGRSGAMATLRKRSHELFTSDLVARLIDQCEAEVSSLDATSDDACLVRVTRSDFERARRVPSELVAAMARATGLAAPVWREARATADFGLFAPHLRTNVEYSRQMAEAIGYAERPFDALLYQEPGMTIGRLENLFAQLKATIVPLVRQIAERADRVDASFLHRSFDGPDQLRLADRMVEAYGFDFARGRQDQSAHPFTIWMNPGDVRITTRVSPDYLPMCLFGSLHEAGHAIYTQGHGEQLARTPLWEGASPGFHESQSRLFENLIGRSRPYWRHWFSRVRDTFPEQLGRTDAEGFYRAVNQVYPSLIRVEADEVTYNLHILLRCELENDLLEDRLRVEEMPDAWNAKMEEYLGVEPRNAAEGPLQDIHWTFIGALGSFPGYTLGNLIGAQLMEKLRADIPDLDAQVEAGDCSQLLAWLRREVHQHGRKFTPAELLERVTGRDLDARPWIDYVRRKFGEIYDLPA